MSTPGCVKLRHFKAMSLVISQILDFFCSPPSRPVSCILSLFQSRPWPAAWRRPRRGEPPWGSPAASCRAAAQAGPPAPPALGPAGSGPAAIGAAEQKNLRGGQAQEQNRHQPRSQPAPTAGLQHARAGGARPPCPWVGGSCCCLPPSTEALPRDPALGARSVLQSPPSTRLGQVSLWAGPEQWMCRNWAQ